MTRALLLSLLALVVAAPTAAASTYPGQRPAMAEPLVAQSVRIGYEFWQARGVQPCLALRVWVADSLNDVDVDPGVEPAGRADVGGGCNVWIHVEVLRAAQDLSMGGFPTRDLCTTVVHEMGHSAGLAHTADGVMGANAEQAPWACKVWARKVDRRKARAFARAHASDRRGRSAG